MSVPSAIAIKRKAITVQAARDHLRRYGNVDVFMRANGDALVEFRDGYWTFSFDELVKFSEAIGTTKIDLRHDEMDPGHSEFTPGGPCSSTLYVKW